ncbi:MAG: HNH endonuclease, partial [Pseudomonadales bacterium]|nr:HNH endonuclease [Pseudomonadales bacterium]
IVPARLLRALKLRDRSRCRFPGCPHQRYVEAHHVRHWIDGGETCLENLVLLCSAHHRLLHHGAFHITVEDDGVMFVSRDGEVIEPALRPQFTEVPASVSGETQLLGPDTPMRRSFDGMAATNSTRPTRMRISP